ncbi:MAG: hypothetical protein KJO98_14040 [Rhodothermia bacterium]|nr:hypothetical protein [Rhodothermia bacterium]
MKRVQPIVLTAALAISAVVSVVGGCRENPDSSHDPVPVEVLRSAATFLWSQQSTDGGWHSETHGILKSGHAWTPFTAYYLLQVPDSVHSRPEASVNRALDFIRGSIDERGAVGQADAVIMEYPNYATSYALRVLDRWGDASDTLLVERMQDYLLGQQFTESRGIDSLHRAYGSWGFGETGLPAGAIGHIDLSHTRRVLEALESDDTAPSVFRAAAVNLRMLQKHPSESRPQPLAEPGSPAPPYDGGFYASTTALGTNKGGSRDVAGSTYFASYATTTCDGILALLAAGVSPTDERVATALQWLIENDSLETVGGIPASAPGEWEHVMFYYHLLVRSEVYAALEVGGDWKRRMQMLLAAGQRPDGSFSNPLGAPNKEDDPILATTMAVGTLLNTLR